MALFLALNNAKLRSCFLWDPLALSCWRTVSPSKGQPHHKQCCLLKLEATLTSGYDWKKPGPGACKSPKKNRLEAITDVRPDTWSSNSTASFQYVFIPLQVAPTSVEKWWISQSSWTPTSEDVCPAVSSSSLTCSFSSSPGCCAQVTCLICIPDSQDLTEHVSFCPPLLQVIPGLRSCSLLLGCLRGYKISPPSQLLKSHWPWAPSSPTVLLHHPFRAPLSPTTPQLTNMAEGIVGGCQESLTGLYLGWTSWKIFLTPLLRYKP